MSPVYKFSNAGGMTSKQRYTSMLAGNTVWNPWEPQGAYDSLATVTVGSTAVASIDFTGIPSGYTHLQVRGSVLTSTGGSILAMQMNGDTGSNYSNHVLLGNGTSALAGARTTQTKLNLFGDYYGTSTTSPTGLIIDILDYSSTTKNKTVRCLSGIDVNGGGEIELNSGLWYNSTIAAITSIKIGLGTQNLSNYTSFSLYGIK